MGITQRGLLLSGALTVAAAVAVAGIGLSSGSDSAPAAAGDGTVLTLSSAQLDSVFASADKYPAGTVLERMSIKDAQAAGMFTPPADIVVTPSICGNLFAAAVGGNIGAVDGYVQRGQTVDHRVIDGVVGTAAGGVDLGKLSDVVNDCNGATVEVRSAGLVGQLVFTQVPVPQVAGAETIAFTQSVRFAESNELTTMFEALGSSVQVVMTDGQTIAYVCEDIVIEAAVAAAQAHSMFEGFVKVTS